VSQAPPKRDYAQLMKDALLELKQLRTSLDELKRAQTEPIVIIGMSCRLPGGVDSPEAFWRMLHDGVDAIGEVPSNRWDSSAYYDPDPETPGRMSTRFGGFLETIDEFDPAFFGISPREARSLDPQQRMLLEVTWEALELAGQSPGQLYGSSTGVFIGMSTFDYALHQVGGAVDPEDLDRIDGYVATGTTMSPAAGRLSYVLGLNGPSMVVDTACSSSLVATHLAVTSLRNRECDMAVVGGVNLILRPEWNVNFTKAHMLAPDGRCKTFDASADGYSRGEGCGVVILQRVSDAVAARRNIIAAIRSSAVNQDGASGGLTVPSGPSQEQVIRRALDGAGLRPQDIGYVEAHGTGTSLGDPIEVAALGSVFGPNRTKQAPLRIGSVKTNIGHLEAAAGVAGLMKVALALRHGEIPPHLHFTRGNPMIDWNGLPVEVPVEPTPWPADGKPRRAGISSFGFTGTNAHVVLEEAPAAALPNDAGRSSEADRPLHLLTASARTPAALQDLAGKYERHLADRPDIPLPDVAFTANTGRTHFRHRLAVLADSPATARSRLAAFTAGTSSAGVFTGQSVERPGIVFLFTGQGSQYAGMGRQLYETQPLFRATLDRCDEILRGHLERPLLDVLYPRDGESSPLDDTAYTQPALFAIEYALAMLWRSWGVEPDAVMGHSVGEYVAACVSGVFSLEDGLSLIVHRARLMQALSAAGQMVAVQTPEAQAAAAIVAHASDVSLAAINGPSSVVISGAARAISDVVASLQAEGIHTQSLRVSHAFHSPLMEPMLADFARVASGITLSPPAKEIISNVTGDFSSAAMATGDYWVRHVREPVRFARGMESLHEKGYRVFVEIGPGSTLLAMGRGCVPDPAAAWLPSLRASGDWDQLLQSLAALYTRGVNVDWDGFDRDYARRPVELPTYPFQRQRYWVDVARRSDIRRAPEATAAVECMYRIEWRAQPRASRGPDLPTPGHYVILDDGRELGSKLAAALQAGGARATLVPAGTPDQNNDGTRALTETLRIVQAAAKGSGPEGPIWCITRGAVAIDNGSAGDAVSVDQSTLWGFGRTVALEHPEMWGGLVDLDPSDDLDVDIPSLASELLTPDGEDQIALRGGTRYVPRLVQHSPPAGENVRVDPRGTYLVAGGLGALGLHAARWLVSKGARSLVLAGRRGLETPGADEAVQSLQAMGAEQVVVARADISSHDDVERLLAQIASSGRPLRGVLHAAGIDAGVPLVDMAPGHLRSMLESKLRGAWHLHEQTRGLDLDLFICFSSVSSIWGAPGRAHYAAANAFLDALAHERRRLGLPALSVNWGPWRGGGMAADDDIRQLERWGNRGLDPSAALRALDALVAGGEVQAAVADVDWALFRSVFEARRARPLLTELNGAPQRTSEQPATPEADWTIELQSLSAAQRLPRLEALLRSEIARTLGFNKPEDVPLDQSVFELGMDSLRAVELAVRLQQHLGLKQSIQFFDSPEVTSLSKRLLEQIEVREPSAPPEDATEGIGSYSPDRESEIFEFARAAWPDRPRDLIEPRWRWMFLESAARCGVDPKVWLYRDSDRIVAHHGAMPVQLQVGPDVFDSAWFVDTMVLESHRASATGARLIIDSNEAFDIGLSLGQTEQMRKIALRIGWEQVAPLQTYVLLLRPQRVLRDKLNPLVAGVVGAGFQARQQAKMILGRRDNGSLESRSLDRFDDRHDNLWQSVKNEYRCAVTRDASYLNWKYVTQPGQDFIRLEFLRKGVVVAVAVLAVDDPGVIYSYRRAFIVDLIVSASDTGLVRAVLESIREHCAAMNVDAIFFHLLNEQLERSVSASGFMRRTPTRFLLVNPLRVSADARQHLLARDSWLITMGDSDIDRPWETDQGRIQVRSRNR
jgi:acyl transferase domain-containing protein/acyl carrier protein